MFYGSIVVIKRTGADGSVFPVVNPECLFGRDDGCDIRVQLGTVSKNHCRVVVNENGQVDLTVAETLKRTFQFSNFKCTRFRQIWCNIDEISAKSNSYENSSKI